MRKSGTRPVAVLTLAAAMLVPAGEVGAWVYPEHRSITLLAVNGLDPARRAVVDSLWASARAGHEHRLCASLADTVQGVTPWCLDWASWPAIAGDHSCSGAELLATVLASTWIMKVADVGARLGEHLSGGGKESWRTNILRSSDIQLQRADPYYATRADSNDAHFLLARPSPDTTEEAYLRLSLGAGADANAIGTYVAYHLAALETAGRLSAEPHDGARRSTLAAAALAEEAFALHFLQDAFAAGHLAGNWGSRAVRKGTHDYYNERGLEVLTWSGKTVVLAGDAHIRPQDAQRAADVTRASLEQVLDVVRGARAAPKVADGTAADEPYAFNVCRISAMPAFHAAEALPLLVSVLREIPAPALAEGIGALPRFRSELGPFIGVSASVQTGWINGGFASSQTTSGASGAITAGLRVGLGLEGVMNEAGDGLAFIDVGLHEETASSMSFTDNAALLGAGALTAAIPARGGLAVRLRLPFWLIPGDLLVAALFVGPFSSATLTRMAVTASNGGLIPWQSGITTRLGRFQLVLGREVGVTLYGFISGNDRFLMPPAVPGTTEVRVLAMRSVSLEFPVLEYRPFRTFSLDQASVLVFQLYGGIDLPESAAVIQPAGAQLPELQTVFRAGIRLAFDWRRY